MAKKEFIEITPEGLNLVTVLDYSSIAEMNGFSGKEAFFSDGFVGDVSILFQAVGNLGAFARKERLDKDISVIIISNKILNNFYDGEVAPLIKDIESKLNQNNSPYRRVKFISEDHLIWYLENRAKLTNSEQLNGLIKSYKESSKIKDPELF